MTENKEYGLPRASVQKAEICLAEAVLIVDAQEPFRGWRGDMDLDKVAYSTAVAAVFTELMKEMNGA